MTSSSTVRGLPGVTILFVLAGLLTVVPVALLGRSKAEDASRHLRSARIVEDRVDEADAWLRLATASSVEYGANAAVIGLRAVPPAVRAAWGFSFEDSLDEVRAGVDVELERVGDEVLTAEFVDLRTGLDAGRVDARGLDLAMSELSDHIRQRGAASMTELLEAVAEASDGSEIVRSAQVASAAANLSARTSDSIARWGGIVTPFATVSAEQIIELADTLALRSAAASELEALVVPGSDIAAAWAAVADDVDYATTNQIFDETVTASIDTLVSGVEPPASFTPDMLPVLIESVDLINQMIDMIVDTNERTFDVFVTSMDEVTRSNDQLRERAESQQTQAYLYAGLFVVLWLIAIIALIRLVERPLVRLGEVVAAAGAGDHAQRAETSGPRELRKIALALNAALDSLERVERQAGALAEERLDDPVLQESAPGMLGTSLQAAVGRLASGMAERDEFQRRLALEASRDGLTSLPNRSSIMGLLDAAMARSARSSSTTALLFLDLDDFKVVNDRHGHHVGDELLQLCATRIRAAIRAGDQVGRLGGDEFIVVAEAVTNIDDALDLAERIRAAVMQPAQFGDVRIAPSVSVGVSLSNGDRLTADEMVREADIALYHAKAHGRGRVEVCDSELRTEVLERQELDAAIRTGLADDEFRLHYQPIVDAATGEATSLEALVRWERPGHGLVPPGEFIPHAERGELVIDLDRWVLDAAARQLHEWSGHPRLGTVSVSVNISGRHVSSGDLATDVMASLERWGVPPERLIVEITETALLNDLPLAVRELDTVREAGVRIALDDFGTGYVSLGVLRSIHADMLKIDQSFVARVDRSTERSLVELMVSTAHLLDVKITAEGVETPEQRTVLEEIGADQLQGFLFGRPVDAAATELLFSVGALSGAV